MSLTKDDLTAIRGIIVDAFEQLSVPRFDALEERMDRMETKMDGMEKRMDRMDGRMGSMEGHMAAQESTQRETNRRLDKIEAKLETIEDEIETLKNDVMALYELVGKSAPTLDETFDISTNEQKLRTLHTYITRLAKQLNIQL